MKKSKYPIHLTFMGKYPISHTPYRSVPLLCRTKIHLVNFCYYSSIPPLHTHTLFKFLDANQVHVKQVVLMYGLYNNWNHPYIPCLLLQSSSSPYSVSAWTGLPDVVYPMFAGSAVVYWVYCCSPPVCEYSYSMWSTNFLCSIKPWQNLLAMKFLNLISSTRI